MRPNLILLPGLRRLVETFDNGDVVIEGLMFETASAPGVGYPFTASRSFAPQGNPWSDRDRCPRRFLHRQLWPAVARSSVSVMRKCNAGLKRRMRSMYISVSATEETFFVRKIRRVWGVGEGQFFKVDGWFADGRRVAVLRSFARVCTMAFAAADRRHRLGRHCSGCEGRGWQSSRHAVN